MYFSAMQSALGKRYQLGCVFVLIQIVLCFPAWAGESLKVGQSVHFRDIHRDGSAQILGNFGLPIGKMLTLKGVRAKPSKVTNEFSLAVSAVNGNKIDSETYRPWPAVVQIRNMPALPVNTTLELQGYEYLEWRGTPDRNWYIAVLFKVTKVLTPELAHPNGIGSQENE